MLNYVKQYVSRVMDDDITALAAQLAYYLLLSFFPFLLLLLTLLGYSDLKNTDVLVYLHQVMPKSAFDLIYAIISSVSKAKAGHLLSISIIGTILSGSSGFTSIIKGLNKAYDEEETRPYWKIILISILFMAGLATAIIVSVALVVFGQMLGRTIASQFDLPSNFILNWDIIRYLVTLIGMGLTFAAIYHLTPCRKLTWREVLPGAILSTLGWLVSSLGFAYYVNNYNNYSGIYGSIGGVIVIMVWLYITSIIILLGGELNALLTFQREGKVKPKGKRY
ncbi:YihY/virulence factor BrkB family protein [Clostridium psychrophilum]|uniref:YihY/virulence factor BrkB family protein n=1 Tax=Clostridium psychrophilum TaxID=132926 RepID=UPI001C0D7AA5|nr:YihY/virulence factor BrkB family protein [Clostridium psychrophilum]MBU3179778.1 YihY/virulence factor BrkB family protein [Clostridium psychrophilum]